MSAVRILLWALEPGSEIAIIGARLIWAPVYSVKERGYWKWRIPVVEEMALLFISCP